MTHKSKKYIVLMISIFLIFVSTLYFIPVGDYSYTGVKLTIKLEPISTGDFYIYFPLFLSGDLYEFEEKLVIEGNITSEIINTIYGQTLNISGTGYISVYQNHIKYEKIKFVGRNDSLGENNYTIFLHKSSAIPLIYLQFKYSVWNYGNQYNIYGQSLLIWNGISIFINENRSLEENGWEYF